MATQLATDRNEEAGQSSSLGTCSCQQLLPERPLVRPSARGSSVHVCLGRLSSPRQEVSRIRARLAELESQEYQLEEKALVDRITGMDVRG